MLQLQKDENSYCNKLIRAIEKCVEIYNNHHSECPIIIKDKPLKAHTVLAKTLPSEHRIAVLDSMSSEDKLKNLVYVFSLYNLSTIIFYSFGNEHIWDATMKYILFGECETGEFQIEFLKGNGEM